MWQTHIDVLIHTFFNIDSINTILSHLNEQRGDVNAPCSLF